MTDLVLPLTTCGALLIASSCERHLTVCQITAAYVHGDSKSTRLEQVANKYLLAVQPRLVRRKRPPASGMCPCNHLF